MPKILDGKIIRDEIITQLKKEVESFKSKPVLAIIQVGDIAESTKYIKNKKIFATKIGAEARHLKFPNNITQTDLIAEIEKLNKDDSVHGIIVQLPLPKGLRTEEVIDSIDEKKDLDGLTIDTRFIPATAKGVMTLLDYYKINPTGKRVVVMGRSKLVGQPIARTLELRQAIVDVVHSQTVGPKEITKKADILIVAIGRARLIDDTYVTNGQVVVDVGINILDGEINEFVGDVNFEKVKDIVSAISPVPGGVGPLTVASLFQNLVEAYRNML